MDQAKFGGKMGKYGGQEPGPTLGCLALVCLALLGALSGISPHALAKKTDGDRTSKFCGSLCKVGHRVPPYTTSTATVFAIPAAPQEPKSFGPVGCTT
jgi:purine-cytosine permease-like protein